MDEYQRQSVQLLNWHQILASHTLQQCLIALGGNLSKTRLAFGDALAQLQLRGCCDVEMSRVKRTRPVGSEAGDEFLNAAASMQTDQSPEELLTTLHEIETTFGRTRTRHWAPRTLDLDLILYDDFVSNTRQLVVPHPAMWYRRFVLDPAIEVAAEMVHPILGESIAQLRERLLVRPLKLELRVERSTAPMVSSDDLLNSLDDASGDLQWCIADAEATGSPNEFARVIIRREQLRTGTQPLNSVGREIVVVGETVIKVVLQLDQLRTAILG